ncbi:hypothetical protein GCM10020216_074600 [Nonomuraea helvata]
MRDCVTFEDAHEVATAGQGHGVTFDLDDRAFAYWDVVEGRWLVAPGSYAIQVGENASRIVAEEIVELAGEVILKELSLGSSVGDWFAHPAVGPVLMGHITATMTPEQQAQAAENADMLRMIESLPMHQFVSPLGVQIPAERLEEMIELSRQDSQ